ncbi:hypothetical protein DM02DRAFT_415449 [Periconia macrospinosa]|uniref:Alcohol acetyltransferase n=1 Tax=Periconia macrospinosa TaxID=97972 RepID=A0A2V1DNV6_9PLEO|nr:hypothetical protein DM02DRAFT_415449 [Periconia macrospinosa]
MSLTSASSTTPSMNGSKSKASRQAIRRLGNNELYQLAKYCLDLYRGTSVSCRYAIPKELASENARSKLTSTINTAIGRVISRSPALQAGIARADSRKPVWIPLSVNLNHHVTWKFVEDSQDFERSLQDVIRSELDERFFDLDVRPGWRVVIMRDTNADLLNITFTWNHPHGDGTGGKIFHELLLEHLNILLSEEASGESSDGEVTLEMGDSFSKFPPATEKLAHLSVTPKFLLKQLWEDHKPTSIFKSPTQADWAPHPKSYSPTRFRVFTLDNDTLSKVLNACRQNETTLTALLNGLALVSMTKNLSKSKTSAFASVTAIDQRRFLPSNPPEYPWFDPQKTIGNYVSVMSHQFDRDLVAQIRSALTSTSWDGILPDRVLKLLWSVSARVRHEILARLNQGLKNDVVGLMKFVPDWRAQMKSDLKKPRKPSWIVTNIGVLQGKKAAGKWSICRGQFTLSTETPAAALLISIMTVRDGEMVVTCTWQDSVVEASLVECVVADLERWLRQIGTQA